MGRHLCSRAAMEAAYNFMKEHHETINRAFKARKPHWDTLQRQVDKELPKILTTINCKEPAHNLKNVKSIPMNKHRVILTENGYVPVSYCFFATLYHHCTERIFYTLLA